jgi:hypothetical protein
LKIEKMLIISSARLKRFAYIATRGVDEPVRRPIRPFAHFHIKKNRTVEGLTTAH